MSKVLIIGGGAAGMMAAAAAGQKGHKTVLLEKNEKLGKKLYITGKGRCNVTNACDTEELFDSVLSNPKFLYSAFYGFSNSRTMEFFEQAGCPLKVERGERVFPVSDHASDVIGALYRQLQKLGTEIHLLTEVKELLTGKTKETESASGEVFSGRKERNAGMQERVTGVLLADGRVIEGDAVIVATGGISYPSTGSTGDGYRFARACGHALIDVRPSLVPLLAKEKWCGELMGLSLKNVRLSLVYGGKEIYSGFGEMLFTHFGISGPLVLSASGHYVQKAWQKEAEAYIDLKPALEEEQLDKRLLRDFTENKNKLFKNALGGLFPARLIPVMIELSGMDPEKKVHEITREERKAFGSLIKRLPLHICGCRDFKEAVITKGGVSVKEIAPSTMESKKVKGLYFAGEVLDLDALTGGFNLQIAWSTGYLAGDSIA